MNGQKRKGRWWRRLVSAIATAINPVLGIAVALVFELTSKSINNLNPTETELSTAERILLNNAVPSINAITEGVIRLTITTLSPSEIINKLNENLLKIAVLQGYVNFSKQNQTNVVDYMIAYTIEPLLAKMNTLITNVINANNLQGIVELRQTTARISDINLVNSFTLNWRNTTYNQNYEQLEQVTQSSTETVITPSLDNSNLSNAIATLPTTTTKPTPPKKSGFGWLIVALGIGTMIYLGRKSEQKTQQDKYKKGLKAPTCNNRIKCKGINKKTGHSKKGHRYKKGGGVVKKVKGLDANNRLKKGYKRVNGKIVKASIPIKKKGLKKPIRITL